MNDNNIEYQWQQTLSRYGLRESEMTPEYHKEMKAFFVCAFNQVVLLFRKMGADEIAQKLLDEIHEYYTIEIEKYK